MIPPTGGPRDSLPPFLVKVTPSDSTRSFNAKTITFTFDEYIDQPQDIFRNLIISPMPTRQPTIESKLRTLTIRIKDTLEPNTTYYYNFGDAIKDINEGNVLHDFSYIFTTGNTLDTMQLSGNVVVAETGGIDTTLIAMLYKSGVDSAITNERPRYITKLDGKGNFRFLYLPQSTYYLYVVSDSRTYSERELFAFADSAIEIKPGAAPVTLYAYKESKEPVGPTVSFTGGNRAGARPDDRRLRFTSSLSANIQDLLGDLTLNFDRPLRNIDTSKLLLSTDSTFIPTPATWELDSLKKKAGIKSRLEREYFI